MSSVGQMRGSIPLFWSQEASRFSPKPDIIYSWVTLSHKKENLYCGNWILSIIFMGLESEMRFSQYRVNWITSLVVAQEHLALPLMPLRYNSRAQIGSMAKGSLKKLAMPLKWLHV